MKQKQRTALDIAIIQMDVKLGSPDENYLYVEKVLHDLLASDSSATNGLVDDGSAECTANKKPDIILFPEMWNTGYALEQLEQLADDEGQRTKQLMAAYAQRYEVNIIAGSVAVKNTHGAFANRSFVFDRTGACIAQYDKLHLFRLMAEEQFLQQGNAIGHFSMDDVVAGLMICYDIRFPELSRKLALSGAKVLFVPAQWPNPRLHHWRTLLQARAIENQIYVIACNRVGTSGNTSFFGHSMVIDPWGEVLVEGGLDEVILRASIDLDVVADVRQRIPIFADRRPELY